jgi:D-alanyl-D-alanine carboxypeptidase
MKPVAEPGRKHHYTDTNYYLLGFIVERVTGKPFHEGLYVQDTDFSRVAGAPAIDHAGGSVIAPLSEYLLFLKALTFMAQKVIKELVRG